MNLNIKLSGTVVYRNFFLLFSKIIKNYFNKLIVIYFFSATKKEGIKVRRKLALKPI